MDIPKQYFYIIEKDALRPDALRQEPERYTFWGCADPVYKSKSPIQRVLTAQEMNDIVNEWNNISGRKRYALVTE